MSYLAEKERNPCNLRCLFFFSTPEKTIKTKNIYIILIYFQLKNTFITKLKLIFMTQNDFISILCRNARKRRDLATDI